MNFDSLIEMVIRLSAAWIGVILADAACLALIRSRSLGPSPALAGSLFVFIGAAFVPVWMTTDPALRWGAGFLYLAGMIVYVESRSLLARGYSMRILLDLRHAGGKSTMMALKSSYGRGMGVDGLLRKRLATLAALHLLRLRGDNVGPLTEPGKLLAFIGQGWRKVLSLKNVG